jgi:long-chain acyl-CoA synthetase
MLNLSMMLTESARAQPGQIAVTEGDRAMTCPNVVEFPVVCYGILRAGAVVVPVNTVFRRSGVAYHLADSGARMHLCAPANQKAGSRT